MQNQIFTGRAVEDLYNAIEALSAKLDRATDLAEGIFDVVQPMALEVEAMAGLRSPSTSHGA